MPAVRRCFTILQLNRSRGLVIDNDHCVADMIKETDWGTMIACIHATRKLNAFTRMLDNKTYVHPTWKGSINNDDMRNATNELQIFVSSSLFCILHFLCIIITILHFQLWWPAAMNPMFAESHKVFGFRYLYLHSQIWYLRKPLCLFYAGTSNIKCLMFNVHCSMFNVPILDVWHMWVGCSQRQGQRSWNWKWGRMHCLQNGLILSQAKCLVL